MDPWMQDSDKIILDIVVNLHYIENGGIIASEATGSWFFFKLVFSWETSFDINLLRLWRYSVIMFE